MIGAQEVPTALISAFAAIVVAALGIVAVLVQQRRTQNKVDEIRDQQRDTHKRVDDVYDHVNRGEQQMGVESGEPLTFREEMRAGFKRNEEVHEVLKSGIADIGEHARRDRDRIKNLEREIGVEDE